MQVDRSALELEFVDLALAVIFAAGFEREQLGISRELLKPGQQFSYRRALEVELSFYVEALGLTRGKSDAPLATDDAIAASSSDQRQGR